MGGYGSGRLSSRRRKTQECVQLPIRELARAAGLRIGHQLMMGECYAAATPIAPALLITFLLDAQASEPFYSLSYRPPAGDHLVTVRGALLWSSTRIGARAWWGCPGCASRRGVLFLPPGKERFGCRVCWGLRYSTTAMTKRARLERRARRYYRLAGDPSYGLEFTPKPKRMRWKTFNGLLDRATEMDRRAWALTPIPRLATAHIHPEQFA